MRTLHNFQRKFGCFTRRPRHVVSGNGTRWLILDTAHGAYYFANLMEAAYCVAIGDASAYKLPF